MEFDRQITEWSMKARHRGRPISRRAASPSNLPYLKELLEGQYGKLEGKKIVKGDPSNVVDNTEFDIDEGDSAKDLKEGAELFNRIMDTEKYGRYSSKDVAKFAPLFAFMTATRELGYLPVNVDTLLDSLVDVGLVDFSKLS